MLKLLNNFNQIKRKYDLKNYLNQITPSTII